MLLLTLLDTVVRVLALGVGKVEQELLPEGVLVVSVVDTVVLIAASLSLVVDTLGSVKFIKLLLISSSKTWFELDPVRKILLKKFNHL